MKVLIAADIHGNYDAWSALPEDYDELWVLGDLVNYGPQPREIVADVMAKASLVVQGNHDNAVAYDDDSRWTSRYRKLSEATRRFTSSVLPDEYKAYLRGLPQHALVVRGGVRFHLTHATPTDPLYGRLSPDSEEAWTGELAAVDADVLLVAHSHVPFVRRFGDKVVLNPGSIGQPRTGDTLSRYAVWQDGTLELRSFRYPVAATIGKLRALALPPPIEAELVGILETGSV
jgi:protein phosphatase